MALTSGKETGFTLRALNSLKYESDTRDHSGSVWSVIWMEVRLGQKTIQGAIVRMQILTHSPTHQSLSLLLGLWGVDGIRRGVQCLVTPAYRWRLLSLPFPGTKQLLGWQAPRGACAYFSFWKKHRRAGGRQLCFLLHKESFV